MADLNELPDGVAVSAEDGDDALEPQGVRNGDLVTSVLGNTGTALVMPDGAIFIADGNGNILEVDALIATEEDEFLEVGDAADFDQLRIERGEFETRLHTMTQERDALQTQLDMVGSMATNNGTEAARYKAALEAILLRNVMQANHGAYLSPDANDEEYQAIKAIVLEALKS